MITCGSNGASAASVAVTGDFRIELPVAARHDERLVLAIEATTGIVPIYDAPHLEGGGRQIAFRLDRIQWNGWEYLPDGEFRSLTAASSGRMFPLKPKR